MFSNYHITNIALIHIKIANPSKTYSFTIHIIYIHSSNNRNIYIFSYHPSNKKIYQSKINKNNKIKL